MMPKTEREWLDLIDSGFREGKEKYDEYVAKIPPYTYPTDDPECGGFATCWITGYQKASVVEQMILDYCDNTGHCRPLSQKGIHFYFWDDDRDPRRHCRVPQLEGHQGFVESLKHAGIMLGRICKKDD